MTKAPRISDAIELALSNVLTSHGLPKRDFDKETGAQRVRASCLAVENAITYLLEDPLNGYSKRWCELVQFMNSFGLNQLSHGLEQDFEEGEIRQGARALWLMFVLEYLKDNPDEDYLL